MIARLRLRFWVWVWRCIEYRRLKALIDVQRPKGPLNAKG